MAAHVLVSKSQQSYTRPSLHEALLPQVLRRCSAGVPQVFRGMHEPNRIQSTDLFMKHTAKKTHISETFRGLKTVYDLPTLHPRTSAGFRVLPRAFCWLAQTHVGFRSAAILHGLPPTSPWASAGFPRASVVFRVFPLSFCGLSVGFLERMRASAGVYVFPYASAACRGRRNTS